MLKLRKSSETEKYIYTACIQESEPQNEPSGLLLLCDVTTKGVKPRPLAPIITPTAQDLVSLSLKAFAHSAFFFVQHCHMSKKHRLNRRLCQSCLHTDSETRSFLIGGLDHVTLRSTWFPTETKAQQRLNTTVTINNTPLYQHINCCKNDRYDFIRLRFWNRSRSWLT